MRTRNIARNACIAAREYDGTGGDWSIDRLASRSLQRAVREVTGHAKWYDTREERREARLRAIRTASWRTMPSHPTRSDIADGDIPEEALRQAALSLHAFGGGRTGEDEVVTVEEALSPHLRVDLLDAMLPDLVGIERTTARIMRGEAQDEVDERERSDRRHRRSAARRAGLRMRLGRRRRLLLGDEE